MVAISPATSPLAQFVQPADTKATQSKSALDQPVEVKVQPKKEEAKNTEVAAAPAQTSAQQLSDTAIKA